MRIAPRKWQGQIRIEYLAGMDRKKIRLDYSVVGFM